MFIITCRQVVSLALKNEVRRKSSPYQVFWRCVFFFVMMTVEIPIAVKHAKVIIVAWAGTSGADGAGESVGSMFGFVFITETVLLMRLVT